MTNERQVYLLDPHEFSPETIAVAFAKTSRSPESFIQIASELNDSKSAQFNEKWVVGYGHSSVAEHAVLHIAVENISRLACECLESNRLASYTEKSTRYQTWNQDAFHIPEELKGSPLLQSYIETCATLFQTYESIIPAVVETLKKESPRTDDESPAAWERRIRSTAIDNCRFLLPAASLANVGFTINARALEHALIKMLSHPLVEVQQIGAEIKTAAVKVIPTLLKYANHNPVLTSATARKEFLSLPPLENTKEWCKLVYAEPDSEDRVMAAFLYRVQNISYTQALNWVKNASSVEKLKLANQLMLERAPHSTPLRELENAVFTFDVILDQGAYYEVKRHRMMTLTPQSLGVHLGYALPSAIIRSGQRDQFVAALDKARRMFFQLNQDFPDAASYVVPNAFNRRFLMTANFRSLIHFIRLRSAPNAHFSVRRLAQALTSELRSQLPTFAKFIPCDATESVESIESTYFQDPLKL